MVLYAMKTHIYVC